MATAPSAAQSNASASGTKPVAANSCGRRTNRFTIIHMSGEVVFYTRPRCPHSFLLRRALRRRGLVFREVDIWQDADAAAAVRVVADGNATVPTVQVGDRWLVNPTADEVCAAAEHGPSHRSPGRNLLARLRGRAVQP